MAWSFGDSFDLYAALGDCINGYWDGTSTNPNSSGFASGRFPGGRAVNMSTNTALIKTSGVNDTVHHIVCSFQQTSAIAAPGGGNVGLYFELFDGATAQVSIGFRGDGAIRLTSGGPGGAQLAIYNGAFLLPNIWYSFEFEVVIDPTAGSFTVRRNGNPVNDFVATGLNTRPTSTNNYANRLQVGATASSHVWDDFFWRSGTPTVAWMGDLRCYVRQPATDVSTTFSRVGSTNITVLSPVGVAQSFGASNASYLPFTAPASGSLTTVIMNCNTSGGAGLGHTKAAIFSGTSTSVGTLLATSAEVTNPVAGMVTLTFPTPAHVAAGQTYWVGVNRDASMVYLVANSGIGYFQSTPPYVSWPVSNPGGSPGNFNQPGCNVVITAQTNADAVSDLQEDAFATYVYSSTPGNADAYTISSISGTAPTTVVAVTTRGYMTKSDAGPRTSSIQLKSGATTVATPALSLSVNGWQWAWRVDITDPNTGSAWAPAAVDAVNIGPLVAS